MNHFIMNAGLESAVIESSASPLGFEAAYREGVRKLNFDPIQNEARHDNCIATPMLIKAAKAGLRIPFKYDLNRPRTPVSTTNWMELVLSIAKFGNEELVASFADLEIVNTRGDGLTSS